MNQLNKKEFDELNTWFGENLDKLNRKQKGERFSALKLNDIESDLVTWLKRARLNDVDFNKLDRWFNLMRTWLKSRINSWTPECCTNEYAIKTLMELGIYKNPHRVPKVEKVVLNMGLGKALSNKKVLEVAQENLGLIAAQKPSTTKTKKSVARFGIRRKGIPIGCSVTLRRERMYNFHTRLILINLPRLRDFFGFAMLNFDGRGNLNFGVSDCTNFIEYNVSPTEQGQIGTTLGFNYTVVTTAKNDLEAMLLLGIQGFPFG